MAKYLSLSGWNNPNTFLPSRRSEVQNRAVSLPAAPGRACFPGLPAPISRPPSIFQAPGSSRCLIHHMGPLPDSSRAPPTRARRRGRGAHARALRLQAPCCQSRQHPQGWGVELSRAAIPQTTVIPDIGRRLSVPPHEGQGSPPHPHPSSNSTSPSALNSAQAGVSAVSGKVNPAQVGLHLLNGNLRGRRLF